MADFGTLDDHGLRAQLKPRKEGEAISKMEPVLRRRDRNVRAQAERSRKIQGAKERKAQKTKKVSVKSANAIVKKTQIVKADRKRLTLEAKRDARPANRKNYRVDQRVKTLLVIRNRRNPDKAAKETSSLLGEMRLRSNFAAALLPNTPAVLKTLDTLKPFVYWGYPSLAVLSSLLGKRGRMRLTKGFVTLDDNAKIEDALGDSLGVICLEDIVDRVWNGSEGDEMAHAEFLMRIQPFGLGDYTDRTKAGLKRIEKDFPSGNFAEKINERVTAMLGE